MWRSYSTSGSEARGTEAKSFFGIYVSLIDEMARRCEKGASYAERQSHLN